MFEIILFLFPAIISLNYYLNRSNKKDKKEIFNVIYMYAVFTLIINAIGIGITYLYNILNDTSYPISTIFDSLSFSIKYLFISIMLSIIVPKLYIWLFEIKNIKFNVKVVKNEKYKKTK